MKTLKRPIVAVFAALVGVGALTACSSPANSGAATVPTTFQANSTPKSTPAGDVVVDDSWIKTATSDMTAVFGMLRNTTDQAVTVVAATTSASEHTELHEVVHKDGQMVMQPKKGDFAIAAGGTHVLKPGSDHIMVMNLKNPVKAGDVVSVTLDLQGGTKAQFTAVAKETTAGQETYDSGAGMTSTGGMSSMSPAGP